MRRIRRSYMKSQMLQSIPSFSFWKSASNKPPVPKRCNCKLLTYLVRLYYYATRCVSQRTVTNLRQVRKCNFSPDFFLKNAKVKKKKNFFQTNASAHKHIFVNRRTFKASCYLHLQTSKTGHINCKR